MLPFVLCHRGHHCMHGILQQKANVKFYNTSNSRKSQESYEWKNFRMNFNYSTLATDETYSCKRVGQNITNVFTGKNLTCKKEDIATEKQIEIVTKTLDNVKRFIEKLLYVIPLENGYQSELTKTVINDADFLMPAYIIACGEECSMLAAARFIEVENKFNRPIVGECLVNVRQIPEKVADFDSEDNQFFMTVLHETFHALGFASTYFPMMHPQEDPKPYEKLLCSLKKYGKDYSFLITPLCHRYAVNHYGVEEFEGDDGKKCPSGIEIELSGGPGTALSHLKGRVFMSDMMIGVSISGALSFMRLTDASLAVLGDTGNYKINWTMAQPLVWGHPESINGNHLKDFALGPPQLVFPENYIYDKEKHDYSLFNFKTLGDTDGQLIPMDKVNCSGPEAPYFCEHLHDYYNPKNKSYIGWLNVFDNMAYKTPFKNCPIGKAMIHGEFGQCVDYACDEFNSVRFNLPQHGNVTCDKNTIGKEYKIDLVENKTAKVWCPDPEAFCRTTKLNDMRFIKNPFIKNVRQLDNSPQDDSDVRYIDPSYSQNDPDNKPDKPNMKMIIIIAGAVGSFVVVCACVIVAVILCKKFKKANNSERSKVQEGLI